LSAPDPTAKGGAANFFRQASPEVCEILTGLASSGDVWALEALAIARRNTTPQTGKRKSFMEQRPDLF